VTTGVKRVLRIISVHDVGRAINPRLLQAQIDGATIQGLGQALMEDLARQDGRTLATNLGDYKLPTPRDIPPLKTVILPSREGDGPYQIRGIGEAPCTPVAPAIANAVEDAIGVRIRDLPITAEKVYRALKERG